MVFIVDEGVLTKSQTGTITGVFYIIYAPLQLVGGILADRWKPERLIAIGLVGAGVANTVIFCNPSYTVMLAAWSFNAVAQFAVWPSCFKIMSSALCPEHRPRGLFFALFANPFGVMVSYLVAALVGNLWQNNFLISAIGLFVAAVYWVLLHSITSRYTEQAEIVTTEKASPSAPAAKNGFGRVFVTSGILLFVVISFIKTSFDVGVKSLMPSVINDSYTNVSPRLATILSIIALVAGVLGIFFSKFWYPGKFKTEASATAAMFLIALVPCGVVLLIGKVNYWVIVAAMSLLILHTSSTAPYLTTYAASRFEKWGKSATVAGALNLCSSLGITFANMVYTRVADAFGWAFTTWIWFILLSLGTVLALASVPLWARFLKKEEL